MESRVLGVKSEQIPGLQEDWVAMPNLESAQGDTSGKSVSNVLCTEGPLHPSSPPSQVLAHPLLYAYLPGIFHILCILVPC